MPYIHLPVQSGSSDILRVMARRYTRKTIWNWCEKLKKQFRMQH